jgi:hypothetical protein
MTLDFNKPIQTRDGRAVRIALRDFKGGKGWDYTILAAVTTEDGAQEESEWYTAEGRYYADGTGEEGGDYRLDLINVPEDKVVFVNVYDNGYSAGHDSLEKARRGRCGLEGCFSGSTLKVTMRDGKIISAFVVEGE